MANKNERVLKLTHDEIQTIQNALTYTGWKFIDRLKDIKKIERDAEIPELKNRSEKYLSLEGQIADGEKDI